MAHVFRSIGLFSAAVVFTAFASAAPAVHADAAARSITTLPGATPGLPQNPLTALDDTVATSVVAAVQTAPTTSTEALGAEMSCLAKVVHHEAANQSHDGQLAVAQVILNRTHASGFAPTVCGVVGQRGQFFNVGGYRPPNDDRWHTALSIARQALSGEQAQIVPGALFYRASYSPVPSFMRRRQQLATLGDHVFYR